MGPYDGFRSADGAVKFEVVEEEAGGEDGRAQLVEIGGVKAKDFAGDVDFGHGARIGIRKNRAKDPAGRENPKAFAHYLDGIQSVLESVSREDRGAGAVSEGQGVHVGFDDRRPDRDGAGKFVVGEVEAHDVEAGGEEEPEAGAVAATKFEDAVGGRQPGGEFGDVVGDAGGVSGVVTFELGVFELESDVVVSGEGRLKAAAHCSSVIFEEPAGTEKRLLRYFI